MPSLKAWVQTPSGLIMGGREAQALECKVENCKMKVESVLRK
jgi:hypothetical protein